LIRTTPVSIWNPREICFRRGTLRSYDNAALRLRKNTTQECVERMGSVMPALPSLSGGFDSAVGLRISARVPCYHGKVVVIELFTARKPHDEWRRYARLASAKMRSS